MEAPITPLSLPEHVRTVVIVGGSFDPPHFYHTVGSLSAVQRLFPETGWLVYVPAAKSPLKAHGPAAADRHRLAMLKLALDIPALHSIWTDELDRARWGRKRGKPSASYTIDTLRRLRAILPRTIRLRLLIGADQAAQFHRWKDFRGIIRLAKPVVLPRQGIETVNQLYHALKETKAWTLGELSAWCGWMAPTFPLAAASSVAREAIPKAPASAEHWKRYEASSVVTTAVARYIIEHRLYGFTPRARAGRLERVPKLDEQARIEMGIAKAFAPSYRSSLAKVKSKFEQLPRRTYPEAARRRRRPVP